MIHDPPWLALGAFPLSSRGPGACFALDPGQLFGNVLERHAAPLTPLHGGATAGDRRRQNLARAEIKRRARMESE